MCKEYRILFTGIGRRVELVQAFRSAALKNNIKLIIYGTEMTNTAPALAFCDYKRFVCGMKEAGYIDQIFNICKNDEIDLVIPTIDTDLLVLSNNIERFYEINTRLLISDKGMIALCRDKNYTADFFRGCGLKTPETINDYKKYNNIFPCFIKPKDGSSSINAFKVDSYDELIFYAQKIGDYVIQSFIEGTEYTVDIFCDFNGNPIYITPRIRMAVRSGEVLKTKIDLNDTIIDECKKLIEKFKPCGPITVQLIHDDKTNENYFIEINPRFGGGAPISIKSGADSASAIIKLLEAEELFYIKYAAMDGAIYSRYDQSICVNENDLLNGEIDGRN